MGVLVILNAVIFVTNGKCSIFILKMSFSLSKWGFNPQHPFLATPLDVNPPWGLEITTTPDFGIGVVGSDIDYYNIF